MTVQSKNKRLGVTANFGGNMTLSKFKKTFGNFVSVNECKAMHKQCVQSKTITEKKAQKSIDV